jgi:hypothetical protein
MRKLGWILIIIWSIILVTIIVGLAVPDPVGNGLHYIFIQFIPEGVTGLATGLLAWGATNGLQAAAVIISLLTFGGILWVGFKRFIWDRSPLRKNTQLRTPPVSTQPAPAPTPLALSQPEQPQVEKPQEAE